MQRKNPAMTAKTHDGIPPRMFATGQSNFMDKSGKHSIQQGSSTRSNNSTSKGGFPRTPIKVVNGGKQKPSPMDILAAMRIKK